MIDRFKNVLVMSPHTDDGELGVGGTIARLLDSGANVYYMAFSTAERSVPDGLPKGILKKEVREATNVLGISKDNLIILDYEVRELNYSRQEVLEDMVNIGRKIDFDLILIPSLNDIHQDHSTVATEAIRAFKTKIILGYELPWNNLVFNTTAFVGLEGKHVDRKVKALAKYESQQGRDYMSEDFIRSLARSRGVQIGMQYAEALEVVRWVM